MPEKPDYIKNYDKPKNTEFKNVKGNWYLYEKTSTYDPVRKKARKKSGHIIGRVTPDGTLHPSTHRQVKKSSEEKITEVPTEECTDKNREDIISEGIQQESERADDAAPGDHPLDLLKYLKDHGLYIGTVEDILSSPNPEMGAVNYLYSITEKMRECLKIAFPDCWAVIYTISMLRAIHGEGGRFCRLQAQYKRSYLAFLYPGLILNRKNLTGFLQYVGLQRDAIITYMTEMADGEDEFDVFDGHRTITYSKKMVTAKKGYDSKHRHQKQINTIYLFSPSEFGVGQPRFYKQYDGNTIDVTAVDDLLDELKLPSENITFIGDKGCDSTSVFEKVQQSGKKYIFAIKRGSEAVRHNLPSALEDYDGAFTFNGRAIHYFTIMCDDGVTKIVVYKDMNLFAAEDYSIIHRNEENSNKANKKISREVSKRKKELEKVQKILTKAEKKVDKAEKDFDDACAALDKKLAKVTEQENLVSEKIKTAEDKRSRVGSGRGKVLASSAESAEATAQKEQQKLDNLENALHALEEAKLAAQLAKNKAKSEKVIAANNVDKKQRAYDLAIKLEEETASYGNIGKVLDEDGNPLDLEELNNLKTLTRETGTFSLKTSRMDLEPEDIFLRYKQRPAVEQFLKVHDDTLGFDSSYMQDKPSEEAWLFFNFISATMAVTALEDIAISGQTKAVSFHDLMSLLSAISATYYDETWHYGPIDDDVLSICKKLNFDPNTPQAPPAPIPPELQL